MTKKYRDRDWLYHQYHKLNKTQEKIAVICGVSLATICRWMKKHGIQAIDKSEAYKGENNPFYGKTHRKEIRRRLSASASERRGPKNPFYGKTHSIATRQRIAEAKQGKKLSEETKRKMAEAQRGERNHFYGKTHSIEIRRILSEKHTGKRLSERTKQKLSEIFSGANNPNWREGISFKPYSPEFTEKLKEQIRKRDGYTCHYTPPQNISGHCEEPFGFAQGKLRDEAIPDSSVKNNKIASLALAMTGRSGGTGKWAKMFQGVIYVLRSRSI